MLKRVLSQSRYSIILYLILGLIPRIIYGLWHEPWLNAPDHMAWDILLDEAITGESIRYDQLIHYPHEGGTILISILALLLKKAGIMNALTLCALIIDMMSRAVQLFVINKISNRVTFHAFAIWSILSLPSILPWASVNFGMHSLLSFVPFGIILIAAWKPQISKHYVVVGLIAGLSIWASYVNLIMLPALAILLFLHGTNWRNYASVFATCAAVILVHIGVRNLPMLGFT